MSKQAIYDRYSQAATVTEENLCCAVDYRQEFSPADLEHIPEAVLDRNYGCGIPPELKSLGKGKCALDLGPGLGRDCFIAAQKVGPQGRVFGLDANDQMLREAKRFQAEVVRRLGYDNICFKKGRFDVHIPLESDSVDVIFSNCVNNLASEKRTAYQEMFRVLKAGSKLSFSDIVSYDVLPTVLRESHKAWADCVGGVLSFQEMHRVLNEYGFYGVTFTTNYLWRTGSQLSAEYFDSRYSRTLGPEEARKLRQVRLYSVNIEAYKPILNPHGKCYWKGHYALYVGPGTRFELDENPDHVFKAGVVKEVCEKTATILKSTPFDGHFTVFESQGQVEARPCDPGEDCC